MSEQPWNEPYDPNNPISIERGIAQFGSEDLFQMMLGTYEDMAKFKQNLLELLNALKEENFIEIKGIVHNFKSTALYVGGMQFGTTSDILQKIIKEKLEHADGGKMIMTKDLTPEEKIEVYQNSVEVYKLAKDFKIGMDVILKKPREEEYLVEMEKYITQVEEIYQQKQEKYSQQKQNSYSATASLKIEGDTQAKCQICKCTIF